MATHQSRPFKSTAIVERPWHSRLSTPPGLKINTLVHSHEPLHRNDASKHCTLIKGQLYKNARFSNQLAGKRGRLAEDLLEFIDEDDKLFTKFTSQWQRKQQPTPPLPFPTFRHRRRAVAPPQRFRAPPSMKKHFSAPFRTPQQETLNTASKCGGSIIRRLQIAKFLKFANYTPGDMNHWLQHFVIEIH